MSHSSGSGGPVGIDPMGMMDKIMQLFEQMLQPKGGEGGQCSGGGQNHEQMFLDAYQQHKHTQG